MEENIILSEQELWEHPQVVALMNLKGSGPLAVLPYAAISEEALGGLHLLSNACWQRAYPRSTVETHFPETSTVSLASNANGKLIGFRITETVSTRSGPVCYAANIGVIPSHRHRGVAGQMMHVSLLYSIERHSPWAAIGRTQNPHVEKAFQNAVGNLPNWQPCAPIRMAPSSRLTNTLCELIQDGVIAPRFSNQAPQFDSSSWIYHRAYGGDDAQLRNLTVGENGQSSVNWESQEAQSFVAYLGKHGVELGDFLANGDALMIGVSRD